MRVSIVLLPDHDSLTRLEARFDQVDLPCPKLPHLTLFSAEVAEPDGLAEAMRSAAFTAMLDLDEDGVTELGGPLVSCLLFAPSEALAALHDDVYARSRLVAGPDRDYYAPGRWLPHLTLGPLPAGALPFPGIRHLRFDRLGVLELPGEHLLASRSAAGAA